MHINLSKTPSIDSNSLPSVVSKFLKYTAGNKAAFYKNKAFWEIKG
jgi:hypothetical protein